MAQTIHLQLCLDGVWHDAATVQIAAPSEGHRSPTSLDYDIDYCLAQDPTLSGQIRGIQALGAAFPLGFELYRQPSWPAFLLDVLPQGHARRMLAETLTLDPAGAGCEVPLLLRAGGSPIGHLRVREAWQEEQQRLAGIDHPGLTGDEVAALDERFLALAAEFAAIASGSSGVQGAWPKILLTQQRDGRWYPDPMVPDHEAVDHVIVKWAGDSGDESRLILASEAPYLELARLFGLRCGRPLLHRDRVLVMPRFDRQVEAGRVARFGQESLTAAAGVAAFGQDARHEDYLGVLKRVCTDPAAEVTEYVLRDVLNLAMGNPDNHGRNTALQKAPDGSVRLTPLYDFCPMRIDPSGIRRSTRWGCMRQAGGASRDLDPDWRTICAVAAEGVMAPSDLRAALATKAALLAELPERARQLGVHPEVIARAMARCGELAKSIADAAP